MTITTIPVWLDCDPGHDDAVALLLACFHPAFDLRGVSACYGNASPDHTDYNARSLLTAMGKSGKIPIYRGAQRPWVRSPHYAPDIHGESGLDGTDLLPIPTCEDITDIDYVEAIKKEIELNDGQLTVLSTGAMTSIANVMKLHPELRSKIRYISIMGGGIGIGNVNRNLSAEFNAWIDPHAANFLFHDPLLKSKIILCPLNLTHTAIAKQNIIDKIIEKGSNDHPSNLRKMFYGLFQFFQKTYKDHQGFKDGPPIHDPMTLYPLFTLYGWESNDVVQFQYKRFDLDVIDDLDNPDVGKVIVKETYPLDEINPRGTMVGFKINIDFYWDQFFFCLAEAERHSTIET
ncbi:similar to Saccharomyces cerevisiae YDR400W URH1 Uridine nucleosidase (uridine-cytidine N-ribohydrolase), cleaves N-glycosidic bonds in nucleosides [Maudiozyma saulgeensis]|uniref:Similar to Saccharomyces cerevisiae YDR400W URH1 Uridine nucleosidase (Uridine-cytidine N-ribohydrolase), cleaves N-glycosidic bonds in nucleosides n=1 Tax=Maudiozyma saulgeensis TaxID=1789683 RepID=A0A1X7R2G9_9SACH|nr:similar to Saccharomyces cerevisiae YDR400W URH1 Uridine nucleosidase (uridine-cytidine N-ribohydrolase), cleaves N-glycosidic bonds in nucleosides [Kazachstania saulgeensis]